MSRDNAAAAQETGSNGWTTRYTADGQDVTQQILAQGNYDGWFVGGLEPGQSKTLTLEFTPMREPGAAVVTEYRCPCIGIRRTRLL